MYGQLQWNIAISFLKVGLLGFGGGPSSIPLFHREVVEHYQWMNDDEFSDVLALANTMPGPIATKLAGYIGYRIGGKIGCFNALICSVLPTAIMMITMLGLLQTYKELPTVQNMATAVVPVVTVMLGLLTRDFIKKSKQTLGWTTTLYMIAGGIIVMEWLQIHPALVIIFLLLIIFFPKKGSSI